MLELLLKSINPFLLVLLLILSWLSFTFNNWCSLRLTSSAYISFPPQRLYFMKKNVLFNLLPLVCCRFEGTYVYNIYNVYFSSALFFLTVVFFPFLCFSLLSMPFQKKKTKIAFEGATDDDDSKKVHCTFSTPPFVSCVSL